MEALIPENSTLVVWLIESTLSLSILVCLILAVRAAFARMLPAWWMYSLWLLLIVRMLVPLNFETNLSVFNLVPEVSTERAYIPYLQQNGLFMPFLPEAFDATDIGEGQAASNGGETSAPALEASRPERNLSLEQILLLLWMSGAAAFALIILYKQYCFRKEIRDEPELTDREVLDLFSQCKGLMAIDREVPLIVTNKVNSPAIYGYFKPRLLLPPNIVEALSEEDMGFVFLHELGHLKRHDIGVSWLAAAAQCLYWFNPLVWIAFHNMRSDQEAACDAFVLSRLEQVRPVSYANTIVSLLESYGQNRPVPALAGIVENKSQLKRRIKMIVDFRKFKPRETILSTAALACIGFVLFTNPLSVSAQTDVLEMSQHRLNEKISFSVDIPENWYARPTRGQHQVAAHHYENEEGRHAFLIWERVGNLDLHKAAEGAQKTLENEGFENFVLTERVVGSNEAVVLDFDRPMPDASLYETWHNRQFFVRGETVGYVLGFGTTDPERFDEFELMAASFEFTAEYSSELASR